MFLKGFGQDAAGELFVMGSTNIGPSGTAGKVLKIVALVTNQVQITAVSQTSEGLAITLVGGTPPYLIQEKSSLTDPNWSDVLTITNLSAVLPETNTAGFFRVLTDPLLSLIKSIKTANGTHVKRARPFTVGYGGFPQEADLNFRPTSLVGEKRWHCQLGIS